MSGLSGLANPTTDYAAALNRQRAKRFPLGGPKPPQALSPPLGALALADELKIAEMVKALHGLSDLDLADPARRERVFYSTTLILARDLLRLDHAALHVERVRRIATRR